MEQIGKVLEVSDSRISQVRLKAILRLRGMLSRDMHKGNLDYN